LSRWTAWRRDPCFERQRFVRVGEARVAQREEGHGEPLLLPHGCPFSSYIRFSVWRRSLSSTEVRRQRVAELLKE